MTCDLVTESYQNAVVALVQYHELRLAASSIGVVSMTIDEQDVVIRTKDPDFLRSTMAKVSGSLRPVGVPSSTGFGAVYYRPADKDNAAQLLTHPSHTIG